jgi:lipoyl-dependent peroxiredoxin
MRDSKGTAEWIGSLKDGNGTVSTGSGAISESPYSFGTRFGQDLGTNPEELIAAAHAACFSMAFGAQLGERGLTAESIKTTATVSLEKTDAGPTVTKSHLDMVARIPGASEGQFREAADAAKKGCPISRLLNAEITLDARLES